MYLRIFHDSLLNDFDTEPYFRMRLGPVGVKVCIGDGVELFDQNGQADGHDC